MIPAQDRSTWRELQAADDDDCTCWIFALGVWAIIWNRYFSVRHAEELYFFLGKLSLLKSPTAGLELTLTVTELADTPRFFEGTVETNLNYPILYFVHSLRKNNFWQPQRKLIKLLPAVVLSVITVFETLVQISFKRLVVTTGIKIFH